MIMKGLFVIILMALLVIVILQTTQHKKTDENDVTPLSALDEAKLLTIDATVRNIIAALDSYFTLHNEYPENLSMLVPQFIRSEMEISDPWGNKFRLETDDEMNLVVVSAGKDMEFGNDDDIRRRV